MSCTMFSKLLSLEHVGAKKGQSLRIDPFGDLRAQLSGMVADVIVEEGSNEEIGMVITRMSPDFALLT